MGEPVTRVVRDHAPAVEVLVVDDEADLVFLLDALLTDAGHVVHRAGSVAEASDMLERTRPDVVLCDIELPDGSGIDLAYSIVARGPETAVVMITGHHDMSLAEEAIRIGVHGYLLKPVHDDEVVIAVANACRHRDSAVLASRHLASLEHGLADRTRELDRAQGEIIRRLVAATESRDPETGAHLERMSAYAAHLAAQIDRSPAEVELIRRAAPMHDIGKIAISDAVLNSTRPFDDDDRAEMHRHPRLGHEILAGSGIELLDMAADIALGHHERWDGGGYPDGVAGEDIPLAARIVAIADVFDALTSIRRYKPAIDLPTSERVMRDDDGHFDPRLLDAFFADPEPLLEIMRVRRPTDRPT